MVVLVVCGAVDSCDRCNEGGSVKHRSYFVILPILLLCAFLDIRGEQVKTRIRCSNDQQLSQTFPRDLKQLFCSVISARRHFWCCLFVCSTVACTDMWNVTCVLDLPLQ